MTSNPPATLRRCTSDMAAFTALRLLILTGARKEGSGHDASGRALAIVGKIPGTHVVFGGDEWWFYGPTIRAGDKIMTKLRFAGYRIAQTKFAGPVMISNGDTYYTNQRNEMICKAALHDGSLPRRSRAKARIL